MKKGSLNMKNSFKKVALLCTALAMNITTFAVSTGGAVAAGLGTAAAVSLVAYGAHKKKCGCRKNRNNNVAESSSKPSHKGSATRAIKIESKQDKKQLKENINVNKKELRNHKLALKKLKRKNKGSTPEAVHHKSMITRIESDLDALKQKLESL